MYFLLPFDKMSERACGENACPVLVALKAHWLHSNHGMPTRGAIRETHHTRFIRMEKAM